MRCLLCHPVTAREVLEIVDDLKAHRATLLTLIEQDAVGRPEPSSNSNARLVHRYLFEMEQLLDRLERMLVIREEI